MTAAIRIIHQEEGGQMTDDTEHLLRLYKASVEDETAAATMQQAAEMCKRGDGHLEPQVVAAILITFNCKEAYKALQQFVAAKRTSSKQQGRRLQPRAATKNS